MRFFHSLLALFSVISLAFGLAKQDDGGATTTSKVVTTVWVTLTSNGKLTTASSLYSQTFTIYHTTATADAASGSMGLGSIQGSVGGVRTYDQTTITSNGAGNSNPQVLSYVSQAIALIAGVLLL